MDRQNDNACIDACWTCVTACQYCMMANSKEKEIARMAKCMALTMECATVCSTLAQLIAMESFYAKQLLGICAELCSNCAEECYMHKLPHCQACAKACEACAIACRRLLS